MRLCVDIGVLRVHDCDESCCSDQITPAETESGLQVYEDVLLIGQVCLCVFLWLCLQLTFLLLSEGSISNYLSDILIKNYFYFDKIMVYIFMEYNFHIVCIHFA